MATDEEWEAFRRDLRNVVTQDNLKQDSLARLSGILQSRISDILNDRPRAKNAQPKTVHRWIAALVQAANNPTLTRKYGHTDDIIFNDTIDLKKAQVATAINRDFESSLGDFTIKIDTEQSISDDVLLACEQVLNCFAEIREVSDFKVIAPTLYRTARVIELACHNNVRSPFFLDDLLFRTHDTLVHCRCYIDTPRFLSYYTDGSLLVMCRIFAAHNADLSLQRAFVARLADRDKIKARNNYERGAIFNSLKGARDIPLQHARKGEYYLLRTYVTLASNLDGFSDGLFIELLKRAEQEIQDERLQLSLHQRAHVLEAMSDGCVLRYKKWGDVRFAKLATVYFKRAREIIDKANEMFGLHAEFEVRLLKLVVTLCGAKIDDHLPPETGMPLPARQEKAKRDAWKFAKRFDSDRIAAQMS